MREPERIEETLGLISQIWAFDQDMRFNQLIYILQSGYSYQNNGIGEVKIEEAHSFPRVGYDLFNTEDDSFIDYLKEYLKRKKEQK